MDDKRFWDIIAVACPHGADEAVWHEGLHRELTRLAPEDIVRFDIWLDEKADAAYSRELWSVASLINGGASDDGFYYFRLWLVGMGKRVYEAALADPDTLAEVVDPTNDQYEAEIYGVAGRAWAAIGLSEEDFQAAHVASAQGQTRGRELTGEWLRGEAFRQRFPRVDALYD